MKEESWWRESVELVERARERESVELVEGERERERALRQRERERERNKTKQKQSSLAVSNEVSDQNFLLCSFIGCLLRS